MRVIHVIPSAFEYFDDIKSRAFELLEELNKLGVETEAFTLQYGVASREEKKIIKEIAPSVHSHMGDFDIESAIGSFSDFDVVHLHCPFFGAAGKILRWKKINPDIPLVITYYRQVRIQDFFSLFVRLYSGYYLPKLFDLSDAISQFNPEAGAESIAADTLLMYNEFRLN